CRYCGDEDDSAGACIEGRDNKLPNHLADNRKCPNAPSRARVEALRFMNDKKNTSAPATDSSGGTETDPVITDVDRATDAAPPPQKKRKLAQGLISGFVDHAMTEAQKNSADRKLLRFIIHANVAFRSTENEFLDDFLHDLRPTYNAPSRYQL
ncbi:hypothetical protein B0H14DRAFT_2310221, partial [Mycena olivaceomarginata]